MTADFTSMVAHATPRSTGRRPPLHLERFVVLALLAFLFLAIHPGAASACSCLGTTTAEMVERGAIVFAGHEVARGPGPVANEWATTLVTFEVAVAYKGDVPAQIDVLTGSGGGDCGVGPTTGLVGVVISDPLQPSIDICGSMHDPAALASLLEPIDVISAPEPLPEAGSGWAGPAMVTGAAAVVALAAVVAIKKRRRVEWQDGWSSEG